MRTALQITASVPKEPNGSPLHFFLPFQLLIEGGCSILCVGDGVGGEVVPSTLTWKSGVPCSPLNSGFTRNRGAGRLPRHLLFFSSLPPVPFLIASTPLATPFFPLGGLSTANRQMEEGCKIVVGKGRNFSLIIIIITRIIMLLMLAQHSPVYQVHSHL